MDTNTRQTKRAPVTLKIKFKSATIDQFIERYAVDVSPGGIFIRTKEPLAVGTQMRFEFQLRDATSLITGDGTVVWTRENDPARPNAAPGMGVRFERLGDGSQIVLDRILTEKARQPSGPPTVEAPKAFTEVPTRVAPTHLVGALASEMMPRPGQLTPSKASFNDDRADSTPLPGPMPFHSDADEFSDAAFEEATKVRSLEELVAQTALDRPRTGQPKSTAEAGGGSSSAVVRPSNLPVVETKGPAADQSAPSSTSAAVDSKSGAKPGAESSPKSEAKPAAKSDAQSVAKSDAQSAAKSGTKSDAKQAAKTSPDSSSAAESKTSIAAKGAIAADSRAAAAAKQADELAARRAKGQRAEPAKATATDVAKGKPNVPAAQSKGPTAVIIGIVLAALVGAAVWFLVLRDTQTEGEDEYGLSSGSQGGALGTDGVGTAAAVTPDAIGGAPGLPGSIDAALPAGETGTLEIRASVVGARVELIGGGSGTSPFLATLEKGRKYKALIKSDNYLPVEIEVQLGTAVPVVVLEPFPRMIRVTSEPVGATVLIDGKATATRTPGEVTLRANQLGRVRLGFRKTGFAPFNKVIEATEFKADGQAMVASVHAGMAKASADEPEPGPRNGSASTGVDAGTGTGPGTGKASDPNKGTDPKGTDPKEPTPTWGTTPPPGGGTGSAEPTPNWTKP